MKELLGNGQIRRKKARDLSVIVCCVRTSDLLRETLQRIRRALAAGNINGEIIVIDDGSIPGISHVIEKASAVKVEVSGNGYGTAVMAGADVARGRHLIAGIADGRYDFMELSKFIDKLHDGYDFALGCRMPSGEGNIRPEAMSFTRRRIVNPLCSFLMRTWFSQTLHDPCSRMFGISMNYYKRLALRSTGSEFSSELVVKSVLSGGKVVEVPITLHQVADGSVHSETSSLQHGGSTLMIYLASAPLRWQAGPGLTLLLAGLIGSACVLTGQAAFGGRLNMHFMVLACGVMVCGWQLMLSCFVLRLAAMRKGIIPGMDQAEKLFGWLARRSGILLGLAMFLAGIVLTVYSQAGKQSFVGPDYSNALKLVVSGVTLAVIGIQTLLSIMILKLVGIKTR